MVELNNIKLHKRRLLSAGAVLSLIWSAAVAQQTPEPAPPADPPAATPGAPSAPSKEQAVKPSEAPAAQTLVGLDVFSSDGTRVGEVRSVSTGPDGDIVALFIRTGGFLGFGGRVVAIPEGRFMRSGQSVRLEMDADQVNGLPEVKD